jgi:hypothetical protein
MFRFLMNGSVRSIDWSMRTSACDYRTPARYSRGEQNLFVANAEIGVAKPQLFPQISLTKSDGGSFRSSVFSSLMNSQLGIWTYGAQVSQPIVTGGALRGNLRLAKSQHQLSLIAYRQADSAWVRGRLRCVDRLSQTPSTPHSPARVSG